jgi:hypothetical protein
MQELLVEGGQDAAGHEEVTEVATVRQFGSGWSAWWVSGMRPVARSASRSWTQWLRSHINPDQGSGIAIRWSASGLSSGLICPVPSSSAAVTLSVRVQRSQRRPVCSRPSNPHRSQKKLRVMPAQSRQIGVPSRSRPGSSRSVPQPGQRPRIRRARSRQVRQIGPSDQFAALEARRPHRAQSRTCHRSYWSRVW